MTLKDELGIFYDDKNFAELYSDEGQPALHPRRLALICVIQYIANLSDRGAVEAVAAIMVNSIGAIIKIYPQQD